MFCIRKYWVLNLLPISGQVVGTWNRTGDDESIYVIMNFE